MFFAHKRGEKIPAKSAHTSPSRCDHHMLTNFEFRQHTPAKLAVEGEGKSWWCIRIGFPELLACLWFAAAWIWVVVTGGAREEPSDVVTCGFPHRPRHFYRQPFADAALEACSAMKTSSCSERNWFSSSRTTRMAAAGAARPGIGRRCAGNCGTFMRVADRVGSEPRGHLPRLPGLAQSAPTLNSGVVGPAGRVASIGETTEMSSFLPSRFHRQRG
jgi:hypothetical protein